MRRFILILLVFSSIAFAARVGLVIQYSNSSVIMKCIESQSGDSTLSILKNSGVQLVTKDYGGTLGAAVCKMEGTGCEADNCFCQSSYWSFYYVDNGSWLYSPVGVDMHYAKDGDVLGFRWGMFGDEPLLKTFNEICNERSAMAEIVAPDVASLGDIVTVKMVSGDGNPLAYESIIVESPKGRRELITNESGEASFNASEDGTYSYSSPRYSVNTSKITDVVKPSEVSLESHAPVAKAPPSVAMASAGISPEIIGVGVVLILVLLYVIERVMK